MSTSPAWPIGFTPDSGQPHYLNETFAHDHFAAQVLEAAMAWAEANVTRDLEREWIFGFGEWAADRSRGRIGNYRMPNFKSWWKAYYAEPIHDPTEGDEDEDE